MYIHRICSHCARQSPGVLARPWLGVLGVELTLPGYITPQPWGCYQGTGLFQEIVDLHIPPSLGPLLISTFTPQRHAPSEHQDTFDHRFWRWEDWLFCCFQFLEMPRYIGLSWDKRKFLSSPHKRVSEVTAFLPGPREMLEVLWKSLTPF